MQVVSVNVGLPRTVEWRGRRITTGMWKEPVAGPVAITGVNLHGDGQADRRVHGGVDKAVYAYSTEDYDWWAATLGPLAPGTFGENLTTTGLDLREACIGDRWHVGTAVLQVSQPRQPCFKLGIRMGDDDFPGRFTVARRPGAYLRVISHGAVSAGDAVEVEAARQPAVRLRELAEDDIPEATYRRLVDDDRVAAVWRRTAARALRA